MSKIPTAEEFFSSKNVTDYMMKNNISSLQETIVILGKDFAKFHAIEIIKKLSKTEIEYQRNINHVYPLTNIK